MSLSALVEVWYTPMTPRAISSAHTEVGDRKRCGINPLHQHCPRDTISHWQPSATPFKDELPKLVGIHYTRCGNGYLWSFIWGLLSYSFICLLTTSKKLTTLSGFCLQWRITDWVFSHPPRMTSYIGSTSAGAGVRQTWQLWGPRYSNSKEPDAAGPNLYSNLSGVLNSAPSAPLIFFLNGKNVGYILCEAEILHTFDFPCARSTPAGAHSNETNREGFWIRPGNERNRLSFTARWHDAAFPSHPKAAKFAAIQNIWCFNFYFIWFGSVSPNNTLGVAPTTNKYLKSIKDTLIRILRSVWKQKEKSNTSYIGSDSWGPIVRAICASLGALILNWTEPLDTGKNWYCRLSSVETSVI